MGRKKIEIQPLPESQIRAKFKKRKSGLLKKAYELGTLCGAQVALIIFSKDGDEVIDRGYNATTLEIIQRYWSAVLGGGNPIPAFQFQSNADTGVPMDSRVQGEAAMDPNLQQVQYMNPQVQQDRYMNPQVQQGRCPNPEVQQDQYLNPQVQQDRCLISEVQQDQYMNSQVLQDRYVNSKVQLDQYLNPKVHQEAPTDPPNMQQGLYMNPNPQLQPEVAMDPPHMQQGGLYGNPHRQQQVSTDPCMRQQLQLQDQYIKDPHRQQEPMSSTDPHMQQNVYANPHEQQGGMQFTNGTNFVGTSQNYMQGMPVEGHQQFHAQAHPTQLKNPAYGGYNGQTSKPGYYK